MARKLGYGGLANTNGARTFSGKAFNAASVTTGSGFNYASIVTRSRHLFLFALLLKEFVHRITH